jgi:ABC-2 type transport system ATP-binding protein
VLASVASAAPHTDVHTQRASVAVDGGAAQLANVVRLLDEQSIGLDDIGLRRPSLDEVFLALTGTPFAPSGTDPDQEPAADAA